MASSRRWPRAVAVALTVAAPAVTFFLFLHYQLGYSLSQYAPAWPNDEMGYFHQVSTFARYGFHGGFYTLLEERAPAHFSHFGPHGPMFAIVQGSLAKVFGWGFAAGPLYNLAFITIALIIFIAVVRPNLAQTILLFITVVTFWPFYWFLPSNLQEGLHMLLAVVFAIGFHLLLSERPGAQRPWFRWGFLALLCVASLVRISWALLLPAWFLLTRRERSWRALALAGVASAACVLALMSIWRYLCAPYHLYANAFLMNKILTGEAPYRLILDNTKGNLAALIALGPKATELDLPTVFQVIMVLPAMLIWSGVELVRKRPIKEPLFHTYNLFAIVASTVPLYLIGHGGSSRVFSVHLLLTLMVLIASGRRRWMSVAAALSLASVLVAPSAFAGLSQYHRHHFTAKDDIQQFQKLVAPLMVYSKSDNGWCNTMLSSDPFKHQHAGVPPGIGLSYFVQPTQLKLPVKSRYLIVPPSMLGPLRVHARLLTTPPGLDGEGLFLNLDAQCP